MAFWSFVKSAAVAVPLQVTGLTLWYDLQDAATVTVTSGKVSAIADKSVSANNASQGTAGNRPVYNATSLNSNPGMEFDGTTLQLNAGAAFAKLPGTYFVIAKKSGSLSSKGAVLGGTFAYGPVYLIGDYFYAADASGGGIEFDSPGITLNTAFMYTGFYGTNNSDTKMYLNNTNLTPFAANTHLSAAGLTSVTYIGSDNANARSFYGSIGEILIYDNLISGADRTKIYNYLKAKWGTP